MKSALPTATIRPDVLLLAAERLHWQMENLRVGTGISPDFHHIGRGNCYACCALTCAARALTGDPSCGSEKDALFATFSARDADGNYPAYIWDRSGDEYEPRILGLLLLREMLKPERKRRPKTVKRKRALP